MDIALLLYYTLGQHTVNNKWSNYFKASYDMISWHKKYEDLEIEKKKKKEIGAQQALLWLVFRFPGPVARLEARLPWYSDRVACSILGSGKTSFRGDRSCNHFYGHSLPTADSSRAVSCRLLAKGYAISTGYSLWKPDSVVRFTEAPMCLRSPATLKSISSPSSSSSSSSSSFSRV